MKTITRNKRAVSKRNTRYRVSNATKLVAAILFILTTVVCYNTYAQSKKMTRKEKEAAWRAERLKKREIEKQQELHNDSIEFTQAINAIRAHSWALEANNVTFNNGVTHYVTPGMNFVSINDGTCVVQTALNNSNIYSPNGLGGVTLEGNITGEELKMDKDGNVYYNYNIQGAQISATVNVVITAMSNQASATINPNYSSRNIYMSGNIYPYKNAGVFEGTPGY